jgi:hypothetical protein
MRDFHNRVKVFFMSPMLLRLRLPKYRAASLVISHTIFSLFFVHITGGKTPQNTLGHVNFIAVRDEFNLPI